ncbi:FAD-dependent oxidoreductase [Paenibacillus mesophilus]|uniref:FAD-dependent oxidoreductase n=1 Tax=Paenibacillus mesophilus TaxID=2582849 RepID=UPI00110E3C3E|nr:FAD-dependent oxidoreductase [Paenibacillus mesophilus]TMV45026.1 FAD-dependent oxidoreductase [Paenibacillus mesophilus]
MKLSRLYDGQVVRTPYEHTLPERYDVIVAGLGTAGSIAAIAAARQGLRVLGIERLNCMGGTGTAGGVLGYYFGGRGGLHEELDLQAGELEKDVYTPSFGVNGETKRIALEREALKAGVTICYDSTVTGVFMEGSIVKGVEWFTHGGRRAASAAVVIDCTGEADVCAMAGCELDGGRPFDGQAQPFSNVLLCLSQGRVRFKYTDSGYADPRDAASMAKAIIRSALLPTHLRPSYDASERLLRLAPLLGIREGRFIRGERQVTLQSFLEENYEDEPLFYAYSNIDNHSKDVAFESEAQQNWTVACSMWGYNFTVPIPLGALIPRGYDGLLAAGRCLSVDHDMAACVRMKRDMQKSGEAAAYAALLSIRNRVPLRNVAYSDLLPMLRESGCLDESAGVGFKETLSHADEKNPVVGWLSNWNDIREGLDGTKPGLAIWSAKRLGESARPKLAEWMRVGESGHLRKHSAFALALLGDPQAAPVLRETVRERDPFVPGTSRKYNQVRGYAAIYLLGLLSDEESVPELTGILDDPGGWTYSDDNKEFLADEEELGFQYVSFTVMALAKIGQKHPAARPAIAGSFRRFRERSDMELNISFKGSTNIKFSMRDKVLSAMEQAQGGWL